jgi:asparagine synthase (glutamine-hydrolysing)
MNQFQEVPFPQNLMALDIATYLPDDLLVKADIASMACSLEVRSPFLDQELMEFAASLPPALKIRKGVTKYLLKAYLRNKMPDDFIERPKTGFGVPLRMWFRKELRSMTEDILLSRSATERGYFKRNRVEKMIQRHCSGLFDHTYQLYALLVLELWHSIFVDRRASSLIPQ